jgi:hypothetical protein
MASEIKFRAWDKKAKIMEAAEEISFVSSHDEYGDEGGLPYSVKLFDGKYYRVLPPDSFDLMQFTGLKDGVGKEIYEGDIVDWNDRHSEIVWRDGRWRFANDPREDVMGFWGDFESRRTQYVKVIGNIYESPELLQRP